MTKEILLGILKQNSTRVTSEISKSSQNFLEFHAEAHFSKFLYLFFNFFHWNSFQNSSEIFTFFYLQTLLEKCFKHSFGYFFKYPYRNFLWHSVRKSCKDLFNFFSDYFSSSLYGFFQTFHHEMLCKILMGLMQQFIVRSF